MVVTSFKNPPGLVDQPVRPAKQISFDNFVLAAGTGRMLVWARNSLIVTSLSVVISLFFGGNGGFRGGAHALQGAPVIPQYHDQPDGDSTGGTDRPAV